MTDTSTHANPQLSLEQLKSCIHCGLCLPSCPTYRVTGSEAESPRGRLYLMQDLLRQEAGQPGRFEPSQIKPHLDQCLGCLACQTACPSGVQYEHILTAAREALVPHTPLPVRWFRQWVFRFVLPNAALLRVITGFLRIYQNSGLQKQFRQLTLFKRFKGLARLQAMESLLPHIPQPKALTPGMSFGNPDNERVALFTGCIMDAVYSPVHWATIEALVQNHYYVTIPQQTCCGALAHHAGETAIAQQLARKNMVSLLKSSPDWVVVNAAGCGAMLKTYEGLLANDPVYGEKAQVFSRISVDIMALLHQKPLTPPKNPVQKTVTYHAACHLHHGQGIKTEPEAILSQIPGLTLIPLAQADSCCGSAGIYNLTQPTLSQEILAEKIGHILDTQADMVVTGNPGCLLQIEKGLREEGHPLTVCHPVELLAEAYLPPKV